MPKTVLLKTLLLSGFLLLMTRPARSAEQAIRFEAWQKMELEGKIAWPEGSPDAVKSWVILLHGSGALDMDENLAEATANKQANPFFKFLSDKLVSQGFGVIRYHKRSYVVSQKVRQDPTYAKSTDLKGFIDQPLTYLLEDAKACVSWTRKRFPKARIHLLGHSEGTYLALQVAFAMPGEINGLGLIGFYDTSLDTSVFEQSVYRPQGWFDTLDTNRDQRLDSAELSRPDQMAAQLNAQLTLLDLDQDKQISLSEFRAANFSNLMLQDLATLAYRRDEAKFYRPHQILPLLTIPTLFFVGSLDNQTPAYQTQAVELANKVAWHKALYFHYLPGLGHGLDKRSRYEDIVYQIADPSALGLVASQMAKVLRPAEGHSSHFRN